MAAALLLIRWLPPPRLIAFILLPIAVAVPLVVLTTFGIRGAPVRRLAALHGVVAFAATGAATAIGIVASWFGGGLVSLMRDSPLVETAEFSAVVVSVSSLAGWFAFLFERFAERRYLVRLRSSAGPRLGWWGVVGLTTCLVAVTVPAWAFAVAPTLPGTGSAGVVYGFYALVFGVVAVVSLVVGLVAEAVRAKSHRMKLEV